MPKYSPYFSCRTAFHIGIIHVQPLFQCISHMRHYRPHQVQQGSLMPHSYRRIRVEQPIPYTPLTAALDHTIAKLSVSAHSGEVPDTLA
jgi:hypothetical protein